MKYMPYWERKYSLSLFQYVLLNFISLFNKSKRAKKKPIKDNLLKVNKQKNLIKHIFSGLKNQKKKFMQNYQQKNKKK